MNSASTPTPEQPADRLESYAFLGYLLAVPTAIITFMLMGQPPATHFEWARSAWFVFLVTALNLPLMLPPFLFVRWIARDLGLANPFGSALWGCLMALLYIPLGFALSHAVDIDGAFGPYSTDLKKSFAAGLPFFFPYFAAGATGMLSYWLISFSSYPAKLTALLSHLLGDRAVIPIGGNSLPKRWIAWVSCLCVLVLMGWGATRWWRPHVIRATAGNNISDLTLVREIKSTDIQSISWSPDGSELASNHRNAYAYTVWRSNGSIVSQSPRTPNTFWDIAPVFLDDAHLLVANFGQNKLTNSFCEVDLSTSSILQDVQGIETDPKEFRRNFAKTFSRSPDGQFVAVTAGDSQVNALLLYSAKDWSERTLATNFDKFYPTNPAAFSPDGHILAVNAGEKILLMDLPSGGVAHSLDIFALNIAFTPDGSALLVAGSDRIFNRTRNAAIFRTSDGALTDTRPFPSDTKGIARWNPARRLLAYADNSDALHVWDPFGTPGGEKIIQFRHTLTDIAFSPDGNRLAVSNGDYVSIFKLGR